MADVLKLHRLSAGEFDRRVAAVGADEWHRPTPCADWDVRMLVNHLVYDNVWAPDTVGGATIQDVGDRYDGDLLGEDPPTAWRQSIEPALAAFEEPGAIERIVHLSYGDEPAGEYLSQRIMDLTIHAWDLARAINAPDDLDEQLVTYLWDTWSPRGEMLRRSGLFGGPVEVEPDADAQTRLLALFGRRP
jgi:uncharacterized protein (TIGR03086 family)